MSKRLHLRKCVFRCLLSSFHILSLSGRKVQWMISINSIHYTPFSPMTCFYNSTKPKGPRPFSTNWPRRTCRRMCSLRCFVPSAHEFPYESRDPWHLESSCGSRRCFQAGGLPCGFVVVDGWIPCTYVFFKMIKGDLKS